MKITGQIWVSDEDGNLEPYRPELLLPRTSNGKRTVESTAQRAA